MPRLKAGTVLRSPRGALWIYACREGRRSAFSREVFHLLIRPNARPLHIAEAHLGRWTPVPGAYIAAPDVPARAALANFARTVFVEDSPAAVAKELELEG